MNRYWLLLGTVGSLSIAGSFAAVPSLVLAQNSDNGSGPCAAALAQDSVCEAANQRALEIMRAEHLVAITVVQDVRTAALIAFAATDPAKLDVTTPLPPLSTAKLMLAASWWDHGKPDKPESGTEMSVGETIVSGDDNAGRRIASVLRKAIGTEAVLKDLKQYGFPANPVAAALDMSLWTEVPSQWRERLAPAAAGHSLSERTSANDWADTLSPGETRFTVTALSLSRFLQAVGNGGVMLPARARLEGAEPNKSDDLGSASVRVMKEDTAAKVQEAMRGVVERGTAKGVAEVLRDTGWQIGGKTGTGPALQPPGPQWDGWFAGLIFDAQGTARFTVATFVKQGGYGGGKAAQISAELARFLSAASPVADSGNTKGSEQFAKIEQRLGGRVGVVAIGPQQNKRVEYRSQDRFPMCSTFKLIAAAAVLKRVDEKKEKLDRFIPYGGAQLLAYAPVTRAHLKEGGMRLDDLCAAAIAQSDNTAGNLLLEAIGGPSGLTQFARSMADESTRLDRVEPELNNAMPGDERDTTTPAAMCNDVHHLLTSNFLTASSRDRLESWMRRCETGTSLIRAGVSPGWQVGDNRQKYKW